MFGQIQSSFTALNSIALLQKNIISFLVKSNPVKLETRRTLIFPPRADFSLVATLKGVWAVVVTQLVELSLLIPEVRGLNPVISENLYIEHLLSTF